MFASDSKYSLKCLALRLGCEPSKAYKALPNLIFPACCNSFHYRAKLKLIEQKYNHLKIYMRFFVKSILKYNVQNIIEHPYYSWLVN